MRARVVLIAALLCGTAPACACGKKFTPARDADAAPTPIQCWRRSGIPSPGARPAIARKLLEQGAMRVYLDPKAPGVVVPAAFRNDLRTILVMGPASPDLRVDDGAISATLSFDRIPFRCHVPWAAVFALTSDTEDAASGGVWEESVPAALFCKE